MLINIVINVLGQFWTAFLGLVFVPIYIKIIGVESYGLVGFFGVLLSLLGMLDAGLRPALSREIASQIHKKREIANLWSFIRTVEFISAIFLAFILIVILLTADWLATKWLNLEQVGSNEASAVISIMGIICFFYFFEGLYASCLTGLEHHMRLNLTRILLGTLRSAGAVGALLFIDNTIQIFFYWQLIVSTISTLSLCVITYRAMPCSKGKAKVSIDVLRKKSSFALGMFGITALSIISTQLDKLIISKTASLSDYGVYIVAAMAANVLIMMVSPISATFFPRFTSLLAQGKITEFQDIFSVAAKVVSLISATAFFTVFFHSEALTLWWLQDGELSRKVSRILVVLAFANFLNAFCHIPYQALLAFGNTEMATKAGVFGCILAVPFYVLLPTYYGIYGVCAGVCFQNVFILLLLIKNGFTIINALPIRVWLSKCVALPTLFSFSLLFVFSILTKNLENEVLSLSGIIICALSSVLLFVFLDKELREWMRLQGRQLGFRV